MDSNDRQAIDGLFQKLAEVERQADRRDAEAEAFIREKLGRQPAAPYYMAQTIVVQEQALNAAQARIEELEREASDSQSSGGGLLGSLFGGSPRGRGSVPRTGAQSTQPEPYQPQAGQASPWQNQGRSAGGGFLAGAAQTAMGVAGGVLLGNAIGGLFGADAAQAAAPSPTQDQAQDNDTDTAADDSGFDAGGDMGDLDI